MRFKESLRFYLAIAQINLSKKTRYDRMLEELHFELLKTDFYQDLRRSIYVMLSSLRSNISSRKVQDINSAISSEYLKLITMQKVASALFQKTEFQKSILLGILFKRKIIYPILPNFEFSGNNLFVGMHERSSMFLLTFYQYALAFSKLIKFTGFILCFLSRDKYFYVLSKFRFNQKYCIDPVWQSTDDNPNHLSESLISWLNENTEQNTQGNDDFEFKSLMKLSDEVSRIKLLSHFLKMCLTRPIRSRNKILGLLQNLDTYLIGYIFLENPPTFKYFLFPNSWYISEPLWNVSLRKLGIEVVFYHYAIWTEPQNPLFDDCVDGFWEISTWNNVWVIDEYQGQEMSKLLSSNYPKISVTGIPIQFKPVQSQLPIRKSVISVFDTHINSRDRYAYGRLDEIGWSDPSLETRFLEVILRVAKRNNLFVVHKKKRKVAPRVLERTDIDALINEYIPTGDYLRLEEVERAESLVLASAIVIAKPISTVALIARQLSVPVCYFDPTGGIAQDDPGLRGIKIVRSEDELDMFVKVTLSKFPQILES